MTLEGIFSGMGEGARDVAGHALSDIQNHYQQFLTGRPAPMSHMPGVMETTTETDSQVGPPESYSAALLKHGVAEGAQREADHWREYANRDPGAGCGPCDGCDTSDADIEPVLSGWERYSADMNAPASSPISTNAPHPSQGPQQEEAAHGPEL